MSARRLAAAVVLTAGFLSISTLARAQGSHPVGHEDSPPVSGEEVFQRACAACHNSQPVAPLQLGPNGPPPGALMARALPPERLKLLTPGAILTSLTNGKMQTQAAALSDVERRAVSEFASGQTFSALEAALENSVCKNPAPKASFTSGPQWSSWGNGVNGTRFQPRNQGKLTAADLPRLKLKWAFGYASVAAARAQPIVAGGRLFAASENREVHALDPKTGCTYWTFTAESGVRAALAVGPYESGEEAAGTAVFFADSKATAYAVDAETGKLIWTHKVDTHPFAGVTGSPVVHDGRLFVPVQGIGEEGTGANNNHQCCTFRGSLTALDVNTGEQLWKTYTIGENKPRARNKAGIQMYGPAGGGIWSSPTVDTKRGVVYVATGNGYADPPQPTTDAVIAMDVKTGAIKWVQQTVPNDNWAMGCQAKNPDNPACPAEMGPDYDFSAAPAIMKMRGGREVIVLPQKSGMAYAMDPDQGGRIVWEYRFGQGSGLGGQWGGTTDGENAYFGVADLLTPTPGGMHAVRLVDGKPVWSVGPQKKLCGEGMGCSAGQGGALTAIPGAVLNGGMDGGLRAYSTKDGSILWLFDTNREFETVNGIRARGASMDGAGPVVVDGMLYVNSGYANLIGSPGNVLLAFGLD